MRFSNGHFHADNDVFIHFHWSEWLGFPWILPSCILVPSQLLLITGVIKPSYHCCEPPDTITVTFHAESPSSAWEAKDMADFVMLGGAWINHFQRWIIERVKGQQMTTVRCWPKGRRIGCKIQFLGVYPISLPIHVCWLNAWFKHFLWLQQFNNAQHISEQNKSDLDTHGSSFHSTHS